MKIGNYIYELLKENETVIIPGFGAFVSNYKPAEIQENEIKPPSREISFTRQIRNNDGLLVGYIADNEKISHFDALKLIEKERENIIFLLDKGEKVIFEKTGELFMNEKNETELIPYQDENLLLDSFGLEPVTTISFPEEKEEIEEIIQNEEKPETVDEEPVIDENKEPEQIQTEQEEESAPIVASEEISNSSENNEIKEDISESDQISEKPEESENLPESNEIHSTQQESEEPKEEPLPVFESETSEPSEKEPVHITWNTHEEKKKRKGWWFLLLLIPIIIAGIFVINHQKQNKKPNSFTSNEQKEIQKTPEKEIEIIPIDSVQTKTENEALVEEVKKDSIQITEPGQESQEIEADFSPKFYLVGGGFKEEENAEKYLLELKEKGLEPFHMGLRGNFYLVGIGIYKTEAEAVGAKREYYENNPGSGAWILEEK